jgi:nucleoside-diphosphate-sugar epimerase
MHVFVAGATGVIGRSLVPLLVEAGHEVTAMTRSARGEALVQTLGARPVVTDALDPEAVSNAVRRTGPDAIVHQLTDLRAGNSAANARLRTEGTRNLVTAAEAAGVERIVAQSVAWAYVAGDNPAGEETALDLGASEPRSTTVLGVAALEQAVHELPEWVVLRYGALYGPGTWYSVGGRHGEEARERRLVADDAVTSFVHVVDAARAAAQALDWPSGAVNICDDEPAPGIDWTPVFCAAVLAPPPPVARVGGPPWARGADNHHARTELGWTPRYATWREGFRRAL